MKQHKEVAVKYVKDRMRKKDMTKDQVMKLLRKMYKAVEHGLTLKKED